jgi:hypothetical protein
LLFLSESEYVLRPLRSMGLNECGIVKPLPFRHGFSTQTSVEKESCRQDRIKYVLE